MKKLLSVLVIAVVMACMLPSCEAEDVWVDHWRDSNIDVYVMDETIYSGTSSNGRYFNVTAKTVRDGQQLDVITWAFSKHNDDMWRFETSIMDGSHTTVVIPRNGIFEFCMDKLGWSYKILDSLYY